MRQDTHIRDAGNTAECGQSGCQGWTQLKGRHPWMNGALVRGGRTKRRGNNTSIDTAEYAFGRRLGETATGSHQARRRARLLLGRTRFPATWGCQDGAMVGAW